MKEAKNGNSIYYEAVLKFQGPTWEQLPLMRLSVEQFNMAFIILRNNFHTVIDKDTLYIISVTCCPATSVRAGNWKRILFIEPFVPSFGYHPYHPILPANFPAALSSA
jgi:hypothetical protein